MPRAPAAAVLASLLSLGGCDIPGATDPERPPLALTNLPRLQQSPPDTVVADVYDWRFAPNVLTVSQGTTVLWVFLGPKGHSVEDVSGMGLFDSGTEGGAGRPGDSLAYRFPVAGRYEYHCDPHPDIMRGTVEVPLELAPVSGISGTSFLVTWASEALAPGFVADIQVKPPGSASFQAWRNGSSATSDLYAPGGTGTYVFRARLRKTGVATSNWSPDASITVVEAGSANLPPVASFGVSCSGLLCQFLDASADPDGALVAWTWDLGDGTTGDVPDPAVTYATRANYMVSLSVTDDGGAASDATARRVTPFNDVPNPVFTVACTGLTCTFTDASFDADGSVVGWGWDFGDGATDSVPNPTHAYAAAGTYGVRHQVLDAAGLWGPVDTIPLIVTEGNTGPVPDFTYECTGVSCTFTDLSTDTDGQVVAWSWEFGDGGVSEEQNSTHAYAVNGDYTVGLRVTDDSGAVSGSFTKVVRPRSPAPGAAFTAACTYLACTFTDQSTDGDGAVTAWSWTLGDGAASTETNPAYTYAANGTYTVSLTVTDQYGSSSLPATQPLTVAANVAPTASFTVSCTKLACAFTDGSTDGDGTIVAWAWDFGDGSGSADPSPAHTFAADGSYTVSLTVTDQAGAASAPAAQVVAVAENFAPTAAFTASCTRLDCTFMDASADVDGLIVTWLWDFDDETGSSEPSPTHSYARGGTYTVSLTVTDDGGKTGGPVGQDVTVAPNQSPTAAFSVSCSYLTCTFTDASTDPEGVVIAWSWDFGDGSGSTASSPVHTFAGDGSYTVTLTVTDDEEAVSGPATQAVTVTANQAPVASFTWSCTASRLCTFDGTGSTDDVGIVTYQWTLPNGMVFGSGAVVTRQFTRSGSGDITLTVTDELGLTGVLTQTITIP